MAYGNMAMAYQSYQANMCVVVAGGNGGGISVAAAMA